MSQPIHPGYPRQIDHAEHAFVIDVVGAGFGALAKHVRKLPAELRRSLTWDPSNGMADNKALTVATNGKVYFCDPRKPKERGNNENTIGLLRQYFPKGKDL